MLIKKNLLIFFSFFLYSTLIFGFLIGEDLNGGARIDFYTNTAIAKSFIADFKYNFFNYDELGQRHSPVMMMFFGKLIEIGLEIGTIRLVFLHLFLFFLSLEMHLHEIIYFFYKFPQFFLIDILSPVRCLLPLLILVLYFHLFYSLFFL